MLFFSTKRICICAVRVLNKNKSFNTCVALALSGKHYLQLSDPTCETWSRTYYNCILHKMLMLLILTRPVALLCLFLFLFFFCNSVHYFRTHADRLSYSKGKTIYVRASFKAKFKIGIRFETKEKICRVTGRQFQKHLPWKQTDCIQLELIKGKSYH